MGLLVLRGTPRALCNLRACARLPCFRLWRRRTYSLLGWEYAKKVFVPLPVSGYFQPLMKRLRSYITRLLVTLFVCSGFSLYMAQPAQASRTSGDFARWLSMVAQGSDAPGLQKELQDLKTSGGQLADMLEHASQIIVKNNSEFDFPFVNEQEEISRELYQLILIEWSQFQTGNAMEGIPVQPKVTPPILLHVDKVKGMASAMASLHCDSTAISGNWTSTVFGAAAAVSIEPMSDSIAIGAP